MDEMLSYIFGGLQRNDKNIRMLTRHARQQNQLNVKFLMLFGCMFYSMYKKDKKTQMQIRTMAKEIDKLKEEREGE